MDSCAIAMDLGSSGLRAQALDLSSGKIISTAITNQHPLPGNNVIDQIQFSLEVGMDQANGIFVRGINRVIHALRIPPERVERFCVCGNPVQLSLLQRMELRDLAYSGKRKLEILGVVIPKRGARIVEARDLAGLDLPGRCRVIIPPAIRHEVGADALALIIQTRMREKDEISIAIDFGTNAEMALWYHGEVTTGSAAAGPALEGRQITWGMLAVPGVISDLEPVRDRHRLLVLNSEMFPVPGDLIDLRAAKVIEKANVPRAIGITGTGTLAIIDQAIEAGLIDIPHIRTPDRRLHLGDEIYMTEGDLNEAGKAVGAVRAGYITLSREAGIEPGDIRTAYISGASGTYVDAIKAQRLGIIPPGVQTIFQVGNTSLSMAKDLVLKPERLDEMIEMAERLRIKHCMFAESKTFKKVFVLEFSHWTEGMPMTHYRDYLRKYGFPDLAPVQGNPEIIRTVKRDIDDLGEMGLTTLSDIAKSRYAI